MVVFVILDVHALQMGVSWHVLEVFVVGWMIGRPGPVGASGSKIHFSTTDVSARPSSRVGACNTLRAFAYSA